MPSELGDESVYCLVSKPQDDTARGPRYRSKVCPKRCIYVHLPGRFGVLGEHVILLQFAGRLDKKELCFGRREQKKFATMGLAKGIVTSRPEDFLRRSGGQIQARQGGRTLLPSIWSIRHHGQALGQFTGTNLHTLSHVHAGAPAVRCKHEKMHRKAPLIPRTERPIMGLHSGQDCVHENAVKNIRCAAMTLWSPLSSASLLTGMMAPLRVDFDIQRNFEPCMAARGSAGIACA